MLTDDYISVGKVLSTHGLKGEIKVAHSGGILSYGNVFHVVYENPNGALIKLKIQKNKNFGSYSILSFEGINRIEQVEGLVGQVLYLHKNEFPKKEENEFFIYELIGLSPRSNLQIQREFKLEKVLENPAHPILVFRSEDKEILVPFISQFVGEINLTEKYIEMFNWEDWFLDEV